MSARPSSSACSISFTNSPLPPTADSGADRNRSPSVVISTRDTSSPGCRADSSAPTWRACQSASGLCRVAIRTACSSLASARGRGSRLCAALPPRCRASSTSPNSSAAAPASRLLSSFSEPTARSRAVGSCSSLLTMARPMASMLLRCFSVSPSPTARQRASPPRRWRSARRAAAAAPAPAPRRAPRARATKRATSCDHQHARLLRLLGARRRVLRDELLDVVHVVGRAPSPARPRPGRCPAAPRGPP